MNVYLAGGAVRDLLLGKDISDRDYLVTDVTRQEFLERFPDAHSVGHAFPVFLLNRMEFSFPRACPLEAELKARDLTVNALLLDEHGNLICHPLGLDDLKNRILRPASEQAFFQDPLRVFRAARFWAKLPEFTPHPELKEAMTLLSSSGLLAELSADRVGVELRKAMKTNRPGNFLRLLADTNCLAPWFDELTDALDIPAGPPQYHDCDVLEHICRVMDAMAGLEIGVWMALCHDLGKTQTNLERLPHHHGHDLAGVSMAEKLAKRLRLPNIFVTAGMKAARWHMTAGRYAELRPATKVDLLMDLHLANSLTPLFRLVKADQGADFLTEARADLRTVLAIRLRPEQMNLGAESGKILRDLRAKALADSAKK